MKILVTGGLGYIGSHTAVQLVNAGHEIVIVDNLSNTSEDVAQKIADLTQVEIVYEILDLLDIAALENVFKTHKFDGVIHFAGLKAVGESVELPLKYYENNVSATVNLMNLMEKYKVNKMIFSSSATVYGDPVTVPIAEDFKTSATNPYGQTKIIVENMMDDYSKAHPEFSGVALRYFNPVGAHESGLIGENPNGIPNNLVPYIAQVATGQRDHLRVWGDDYDTIDGTGVRDYIHVEDLAHGHLKALEYTEKENGMEYVNLGAGKGYSVLEVKAAFEKASGREIPHIVFERRAGDIATSFANPQKALQLFDWQVQYNLDRMCQDSWRFIDNLEKGEEK
ncbi:MAG: UDP-glucose 4-epimerase GalE [Erysipelothrix sp.]|nr:UDP-glucose 4-epimerase GalE [Erysipelothrix sp.]